MSREAVFNRAGLLTLVGIAVLYFASIGWRMLEAGALEGQKVPELTRRLDKLEKKVDLLVEAAIRRGDVSRQEANNAKTGAASQQP